MELVHGSGSANRDADAGNGFSAGVGAGSAADSTWSFEIAQQHTEAVRREAQKINYPLMEEYDFHAGEYHVPRPTPLASERSVTHLVIHSVSRTVDQSLPPPNPRRRQSQAVVDPQTHDQSSAIPRKVSPQDVRERPSAIRHHRAAVWRGQDPHWGHCCFDRAKELHCALHQRHRGETVEGAIPSVDHHRRL